MELSKLLHFPSIFTALHCIHIKDDYSSITTVQATNSERESTAAPWRIMSTRPCQDPKCDPCDRSGLWQRRASHIPDRRRAIGELNCHQEQRLDHGSDPARCAVHVHYQYERYFLYGCLSVKTINLFQPIHSFEEI